MIHDTLENAGLYFPALRDAFAFLSTLGPDTPDGEYEIQGRQMFARVMRYQSRPRPEGRMEAHRMYADIQAVLEGAEAVEWAPLASLPGAEYDEDADVSFHSVPPAPGGRFILVPGLFCLFMAGDAHMPMLEAASGPAPVTKVVIKIDMRLMDNPA